MKELPVSNLNQPNEKMKRVYRGKNKNNKTFYQHINKIKFDIINK